MGWHRCIGADIGSVEFITGCVSVYEECILNGLIKAFMLDFNPHPYPKKWCLMKLFIIAYLLRENSGITKHIAKEVGGDYSIYCTEWI